MKLVALVLALDGGRVIDFVLANLVSAKISTIYVIAQYESRSLVRHIDTMWGGIGADGRIRVLRPRSNDDAYRYQGSADAVYRNLELIERHQPDAVAVLAMDRVFRMDMRQMADAHQKRGAYATVAAAALPLERARSFGVIATDASGRITQFQEKPARPAPMPTDPARAYASMGNYVFDPYVLAGLLRRARKDGGSDFGRDILPALVRCPRVFAYDFASNQVPGLQAYEETGYWRDVGNLGNPRWPIHSGHNFSREL